LCHACSVLALSDASCWLRSQDCGTGYCEHQKIKAICKICDGQDICKHYICIRDCKECRPENVCKHNQLHRACTECNSNLRCRNNRKCNGTQCVRCVRDAMES
jgi:hypothetical protein